MKTWTNHRGQYLPPGPWTNEPDRLQWVDKTTELDCLIVRGPFGALCGYVGVPNHHHGYGRFYDDIRILGWLDIDYPDVHGGLTYSNPCQGNICHIPEPGRPDDVWWFGFDCSHYMDKIPDPMLDFGDLNTYRDITYVRAECANLAAQLAT